MKYFSLKCLTITFEYDTQILPLLRRFSNLEELTLRLWIHHSKFIDGTHLYNEILVHMLRLNKFVFFISNSTDINDLIPCLSNDYLQRTFKNIGYDQVVSIIDYIGIDFATYHIFSLPFGFDRFESIDNNFPSIVFNNVTYLCVSDDIPFEHEFFKRIAQFFPFLKNLHISNSKRQSSNLVQLQSNIDQSYSIVEYPHLTSLNFIYAHIDYAQQFLLHTRTSVPQLTELEVGYE